MKAARGTLMAAGGFSIAYTMNDPLTDLDVEAGASMWTVRRLSDRPCTFPPTTAQLGEGR